MPAVLFLAVATGAALWLSGAAADVLLLRSLTVLLISCPCVLGLAVPLAKVVVIDRARRKGIIVRDPDALERLRGVNTVAFDKTGTLTEGDFSFQSVVCPGLEEHDGVARLAVVESQASHFLAREVLREAGKRGIRVHACEAFEAFQGLGVRGRAGGDEICIGSRELMKRRGLKMAPAFDHEAQTHGKEGKTVVFFGWSGRVRGYLAFGDSLRRGAREAVETLRKRSVALWLVSGDDESTTRAVAERLGIEQVLSGALPDKKVRLVKDLQSQGLKVAMVGDGINDAGAMAESDVGIAFGAGMDLIREASDLTFLSSEPGRLLDVFVFGRSVGEDDQAEPHFRLSL